ncbi:AAA family ATPase [Streptomyces sp. NBC_01537]|uniref:TniB family NTP-binding protein n=1 Tax=Streptomyces sp. NBC_01537 TaxID=2903896 RepID=UPI00386311FA
MVDRAWTVVGLSGGRIVLADAVGATVAVSVTQLLSQPVELIARGPVRPTDGRADVVADKRQRAVATFWERHVVEVQTGLPPDAGPGVAPKPEYDPAVTTLAERELAKSKELAAAGLDHGFSAGTVRRKRQRYQADGFEGLLDGRSERTSRVGARIDPRVLDCLLQVLHERRNQPRRSVAFYRAETEARVRERHGYEVAIPSHSTFYRLISKLLRSGAAKGRARRRRHLAPARSARPGARAVVDVIDLYATSSAGAAGEGPQARATVVLDVATGSVCALLLHPVGTTVDGRVLLMRLCTPRNLLEQLGSAPAASLEESTGSATAAAVIVPERLDVEDTFLARSVGFRAACRQVGIRVRVTDPRLPRDAAHVERLLGRLADGLTDVLSQELTGAPELTWERLASLQPAVDQWVTEVWQNLPVKSGDRHRATPGGASPNQIFADAVTDAGAISLPRAPHVALTLLPRIRRHVTAAGLLVDRIHYDSPRLDPLRAAPGPSGPVWVRKDFYDRRQVWVELGCGEWLAVPQKPPSADQQLTAGIRSFRQGEDATFLSAHPRPPVPVPAQVVRHAPLTSLEGWRNYISAAGAQTAGPGADPHERLIYHARLSLEDTPLVREVREHGWRLAVLKEHTLGPGHDLLVTGPAGFGKTTALIEFGRSFELRDRARHGQRPTRIPTVYVALRPTGTARDLVEDLARFVQYPIHPRRHMTRFIDDIRETLTITGTGVVLIDDMHYAWTGTRETEIVDVLRHFADRLPALFVYAGIQSAGQKADTAGFRRMVHVQADRLTDASEWARLVAELDVALRLDHHRPGELSELAVDLHQLSGGNVSGLMYLVRAAAVSAVLNGSERVSLPALRRVAASHPADTQAHEPGAEQVQ